MASSNCNDDDLPSVDMQHPEVLTCEQLCNLFKQKQIAVEPDKCSIKEELLNLFYHTLMPLPQRDYKPTRRGQLLSSKQEKVPIDAKAETSNTPQKIDFKVKLSRNFSSLQAESSPKSSNTSKSSHNLITFETTAVTAKQPSSSVNGIDKCVKSKKSEATGISDDNKRSKIIRLINDTITSNRNGSSMCHTSKRKSMSTSTQDTSTADESTPRKKHKPITWP